MAIHCQKGKGTDIDGRKVGKITDIFPDVQMVLISIWQQLLHTICMSHADTTEEAVGRSHPEAIRSITPLGMAHKSLLYSYTVDPYLPWYPNILTNIRFVCGTE